MKPTKNNLISAIAKSLRDFGYPDVTDGHIRDCWDAYEAGLDMPHDIVGMFAERQLEEISQKRPDILSRNIEAAREEVERIRDDGLD